MAGIDSIFYSSHFLEPGRLLGGFGVLLKLGFYTDLTTSNLHLALPTFVTGFLDHYKVVARCELK